MIHGFGAARLIQLDNAPARKQYQAEIRPYLTKQAVGLLAVKATEQELPIMLVADYVNRPQADRLRQLNIPFIDAAGNAYVAEHQAYWGGEIAADRLTCYLKPQDATIYADKVPARLLLENSWILTNLNRTLPVSPQARKHENVLACFQANT